jgi:hypothetical protein
MHGEGHYIWPDGCFYKGQWFSDCRSGQGIERLSDGSQYEGNFVNNARNGLGIMLYTDGSKYQGHWQHEHWNGLGTFTSADGSVLEGLFVNGVIQGHGTEKSANGEYFYEGDWNDGVREGQGFLKTPIGEYIGEFSAGKKQGQGKDTFASGSTYSGQFDDNQRHGYGVISYSDGRIYDGHWKHGEYCGHGKYVEPNGYGYCGEWENDQKHGRGSEKIDKDTSYEGQFHKGMRHGKGKITAFKSTPPHSSSSNSQTGLYIHEGMYSHNKKSGIGSEIYPDGSCFHGVWSNDLKHGPGLLKIADDATYHVIFHEDTIVDIFFSMESERSSNFSSSETQSDLQYQNALSPSVSESTQQVDLQKVEIPSSSNQQGAGSFGSHPKNYGSSRNLNHVRFDPFQHEAEAYTAQTLATQVSTSFNRNSPQGMSVGQLPSFSDFAAEVDSDMYEVNEADLYIPEAARMLSPKVPILPSKVTVIADYGIWGATNIDDLRYSVPTRTPRTNADLNATTSQFISQSSLSSGIHQHVRRSQGSRLSSSSKQHRPAGSSSKESVVSSGSKNTHRVDIFNL